MASLRRELGDDHKQPSYWYTESCDTITPDQTCLSRSSMLTTSPACSARCNRSRRVRTSS